MEQIDRLVWRVASVARSRRGRTILLVLYLQVALVLAALVVTVALSGPRDLLTLGGVVLAVVVFALLARVFPRGPSAEVRFAVVRGDQPNPRER
jgi:Kef-type K+ transport system membrane component KefB